MKKKKKKKKKKNQGLPLSRQTPYHWASETVPSDKTSTPKATDTGLSLALLAPVTR